MILTDEERERIEHGCWSGPGLGASFDRQKFAAAIEREVLRKLRERPADAVLLTYDSGERELRFHNNGWPAAETPLHIIPEVNE